MPRWYRPSRSGRTVSRANRTCSGQSRAGGRAGSVYAENPRQDMTHTQHLLLIEWASCVHAGMNPKLARLTCCNFRPLQGSSTTHGDIQAQRQFKHATTLEVICAGSQTGVPSAHHRL